MNHYERNRKAVQQGLNRRAAKRREAAMDAKEREAREELNRITAERRRKIEAAEAAQRRQMQCERRRRIKEAKKSEQRQTFFIRSYASLAVAAVTSILFTVAALAPWLAMTGVILASVYFFGNIAAYATRNVKRGAQR